MFHFICFGIGVMPFSLYLMSIHVYVLSDVIVILDIYFVDSKLQHIDAWHNEAWKKKDLAGNFVESTSSWEIYHVILVTFNWNVCFCRYNW